MIFAFIARLGVPQRLVGPLLGVIALIGLVASLSLLKGCYDRSVVDRHQAEVEAAASKARETASAERAADAITNTTNEKDLQNAIDNAPKGGELSPAARALACERLRKLGRIPTACRPEGGN